MAVYNGEQYLAEAVECILNQTFGDFEFVIVDDGSTDGTPGILARYEQADARIRIHTHASNAGIVASANDGCRVAAGQIIARMDADDLCPPSRLERQLDYLTRHPEIGVLGAWFRVVDQRGATTEIQRPPTMPGVIGWTLLFANCFCNSSVVIRREVLERASYYRPEAAHGTEDYDLFVRLSRVTRLENLPEILCSYRFWQGNISNRRAELQEPILVRIVQDSISDLLGATISAKAARYLRGLTGVGNARLPDGLQEIREMAGLLRQSYRRYREKTPLRPAELRAISWSVAYRLYVLSGLAARHSRQAALMLRAQALAVNPSLALTIDARKLIRRALAK